jgi:transketolase
VTTGVSLQVCLAAAERLSASGLEAGILHLPTVKPLDVAAVLAAVKHVPVVLSVEEHTLMGGLGSAIAEVLAETDLLGARRFGRIGIPDAFADRYGDQNGLMKLYGISAENVAEQVLNLRSLCRSRIAPASLDRAA